ncbi:MAG: hypothetical protein CME61_03405 [Halobacteriovoraceae bacterium]|nr:hypothetical protein [Halobacteriovoraceae bacterium]
MNKIIISLITLMLVGCYQTRQGELEVYESVTLKNKKGENVSLEAGMYNAKLKLKERRKFQLLVPSLDQKFIFKVPRGIKLPTQYGKIKLTSEELKQPVDVEIVSDRKDFKGPIYETTERCSDTTYVRVCRIERTPARRECRNYPDGSRRCRSYPPRTRRVCRNEPRTVYGDRRVSQRDVTVERSFVASINLPGTESTVGEFDSTKITRSVETVSYGVCRIDRRRYPGIGPLVERPRY